MTATLTPNLMTDDVNGSIAFYCDRLGFRFVAGVPFDSEAVVGGEPGRERLQWGMIQREGASLMFQARDSLAGEYPPLGQAAIGASATLYLEVGDLDALLEGLAGRAEVVLPDHVTFYGMREVWIRDHNGYLLTLAEKAGHDDGQA